MTEKRHGTGLHVTTEKKGFEKRMAKMIDRTKNTVYTRGNISHITYHIAQRGGGEEKAEHLTRIIFLPSVKTLATMEWFHESQSEKSAFRIEKKRRTTAKDRWNDCEASQRKDKGGMYGFNTDYQRNEACVQH